MFFVIIYLARSQIAVFGCQFRGAEATCSLHGSPAGWRKQSVLTDFHELRKDFPGTTRRAGAVRPNPGLQKRNLCPFSI